MQEGLPDPNHREPLDARLSLWFAAQVILDAPARLIEAGAGAEARIELASVYVDLAAEGCGEEEIGVTRRLCRAADPVEHRPLGRRYLLVGGPGSGKSTATTMAAQLLRAPWVRAGAEHLPAAVREAFEKAAAGLDALSAQVLEGPSRVAIPLRVSLPALARSIANGSGSSRGAVWRFLAGRMADDVAAVGATVAMDADTLREMAPRSAPVFWIFDGLDEVPRSAGREAVVGAIREVLAEVASGVDGLVVSTRPQGYEGEFDALDPLVLRPLEEEEATEHGERLLRAWLGAGATLTERVEDWRRALARDDIRSLVTSPLHTAMAALLVAAEGTLPASRAMLFQLYFEELFKRELTKPAGDRLQRTEREVVQALHARVGLILHVRAQEGSGAHAELSRRELREVLTSLYRGYRSAAPRDAGEEEVVRGAVERMMRFTTERLVLLLHGSDGGYSFGVRSLQEYFAAVALGEGHLDGTRRALERVALDPHWENVLALLVSDCALWPLRRREEALAYTVGLCRALAEGTVGGEAAVRCCAGSRLALVMLRETERYGHAWLHEPLWELAFRAADAPVQMSVRRMTFTEERGALWREEEEVHAQLGGLAARWTWDNASALRGELRSRAEGALRAAEGDRDRGWLLLQGLLREEDLEAEALADRFAPSTAEHTRQLASLLLDDDRVLGSRWLERRIEAWRDEIAPGQVMRWRAKVSLYSREASRSSSLAELFERMFIPAWHIYFRGDHLGSGAPLESTITPWCAVLGESAPRSDLWKALWAAAEFHDDPTPTTLAAALVAASEPGAREDLLSGSFFLPWPLEICLAEADSASALARLAALARAGDLGTADDWRRAEARWRSNPHIELDELTAWWAREESPWGRDIGDRGIALAWHMASSLGRGVYARAFLEEAQRALSPDPTRRPRAARLLRALLAGVSHGESIPSLRVPATLARAMPEREPNGPFAAFYDLDTLLPDLTGPDAEGWFGLLDTRGKRRDSRHSSWGSEQPWRIAYALSSIEALLLHLRAHPDRWGLLDTLSWLVLRAPDAPLEGLTLPVLPLDALPQRHAQRAMLHLLAGSYAADELPSLIRALHPTPDVDLRATLAEITSDRTRDRERLRDVLLAALREPAAPAVQDRLVGALYTQLRRPAEPAFLTATAWRDHGFPEPFLGAQAPDRYAITAIPELANLRLFRDTPTLDAPLPRPPSGEGQWIVLVGENGSGKTTLLRALALALASPAVASKLLDEKLPFVRNGGDGRVGVQLDGATFRVAVRRDERARTETVVPLVDEPPHRPWVVGYGVRRGNARGEDDRPPAFGPMGDLHSLFDRPAALVHAVDWLKELHRNVLLEGSAPRGRGVADGLPGERAAIWRAVVRAMTQLLGVTEVEPGFEHVTVKHPKFGDVRFDALSDGYLTTAGWVLDMIARWIDRQRDLDERVGPDPLRRMAGFALVDELDLHLHPVWQMNIVDDLRRLFPRMSFVVTTHNPLTLQGARPGETFIMRREGNDITLVQRDVQPGHDVDRVLFEQFNLRDTFDRETRAMLRDHRAMLEAGASADDPGRLALERQLEERLGAVGSLVRGQRRGKGDPMPRLRDDEQGLLDALLDKE